MSAPNPPGRDAIAYRAGTHAGFRAAMLDQLGGATPLAGLRTRDADDPIVATCDAWATALDILTFLTERSANEAFVRTATERRSLVELARAVGYELRPGVAADTHLAFTVIASPGAPAAFPLPAGTRAQSVPGAGELPQVFETVEPIAEARPEWNSQPVRAAATAEPAEGDTSLRLAGTDLGLVPGDAVLIVAPDWFDVRRIDRVETMPAVPASDTDFREVIAAHLLVHLDTAIVARPAPAGGHGVSGVEVHHLRQRAAVFGYNAPDWEELPLALRVGEVHPALSTIIDTVDLTPYSLALSIEGDASVIDSDTFGMSVLEQIGAISVDDGFLPGYYANAKPAWADAAFPAGTTTIHLDQAYPSIIAGSWAVFERDGAIAARRVTAVAEVPHKQFALSGRVTRLTLSGDVGGFAPRTTAVLAASRHLPLGPAPLPELLAGVDTVELAFGFGPTETPLAEGRTVIISGLDATGEPAGEVATIHKVLAPSGAGPRLRLAATLTETYHRTSVRVLGNAARATHGESRAQVLGSGDQRIPFQSFTVTQPPLTHTRAPTESGIAPTLAVWVQGARWQEVRSLHGRGPTDRVYVTRRADDGAVRVTFGDGRTGARLPTGRDNVVATFRTGIGTAANLGIGRLTIPLARPLGLREVTNPVDAADAADPETLADARRNAPLPTRTIGRVVSLADYADFARAYAGVGKARSDMVWDGQRNVIVITVARTDGTAVDPTGPLATGLLGAIDKNRHASVATEIIGAVTRTVAVGARLVVSPDRRFTDVRDAAVAALVDAFSFDRVDFARPLPLSDVLAVVHSVPGVVGVLVDTFHQATEPADRLDVIASRPARRVGGATLAAEILTVAPDGAGITFTQESES